MDFTTDDTVQSKILVFHQPILLGKCTTMWGKLDQTDYITSHQM